MDLLLRWFVIVVGKCDSARGAARGLLWCCCARSWRPRRRRGDGHGVLLESGVLDVRAPVVGRWMKVRQIKEGDKEIGIRVRFKYDYEMII